MTQARGALRRATLLVAVAALTAAGIATSTTSSEAAKPDNKGNIAKARFFSFNDFHGALDAADRQRRPRSTALRPAARSTSRPP